MRPVAAFLLLIVLSVAGCKKDSFITSADASISFSADTLNYDTVFTSVGSVTKLLRIYNNNDQKLRLGTIELAGGVNSSFKINVDGLPGSAKDIEIESRDSLYVFISVTVNPGAANAPFVLEDSLRIGFNGNARYVQLRGRGQNAHFLRKHTVTGNETWTNDKPYVILDGITIAKNASLSIQKGSKIYFHANSPLIVDGSLKVTGEKYDSTRVQFLGDRLDAPYKDYPGAWPGIYFTADSHDNIMEYATVSNAFQGIVVDQPAVGATPKLVLNESIIRNCYDAGFIGIRGTVRSRNTLIANCGKNMIIAFGGEYEFTHLTSVAYSNNFVIHKDPLLSVTNVFENSGAVIAADLNAVFRNSIFWADGGFAKEEIVVKKEGTFPFSISFSNSLWKLTAAPANTTATSMISNQDPLFLQVENDRKLYNFRLKDNSPAIGKGAGAGVVNDLDGNNRKTLNPDIGAYEKQ